MILTRILPGVLKELAKHVPTVLFQTVEWSDLASEVPKISRRIIQKEGYLDLVSVLEIKLKEFNVVLSKESIKGKLHPSKSSGIQLLTIYFAQLFGSEGIFLDLRSSNFESVDDKLIWHPTGLWTPFSESFRIGLLKVYEGFYLENDELYYEGLEAIGLIQKDWSKDERKKLGDLFRKQFGNALEEEMSFDLDHFKDSIIAMSHFLLEKKTKISKDFLYLGIYLVTLYSSLDEMKIKLPVKQIYLNVKKKLDSY